jgi:replicative DNA helicase
MASLAAKLLNIVLNDGPKAYREVLRHGFRPEWIRDPELNRVWKHISLVMAQYRETPSPDEVSRKFTHFTILPEDELKENLLPLTDEIRQLFVQAQMAELLDKAGEENVARPDEAVRMVSEGVMQLSSLVTQLETFDVVAAADDIRQEYRMSGTDQGLGIRWPWPTMQSETGGMYPDNFILFFGRPKNMKTFIALYVGVQAYLRSAARVLIISREMNPLQIRKRIVAMLTCVAYGPWRKGHLEPHEVEHVFSVLDSLMVWENDAASFGHPDLGPAIRIASGHSKQYSGLDLVDALANDFYPDIIIDDGFYLAAHHIQSKQGPMDWRVLTHLSQAAKAYAMRNHIVYIATSQANREAEKASHKANNVIAYTDALMQDCDLVVRVIKVDADAKKGRPRHIIMGLPGLREGEVESMVIHADPCTNFEEMGISDMKKLRIDSTYIEEAENRDGAHAADDPAGPETSCDEVETEIPALNMDSVPEVEPAKKPKKAPKKKPAKKKTAKKKGG